MLPLSLVHSGDLNIVLGLARTLKSEGEWGVRPKISCPALEFSITPICDLKGPEHLLPFMAGVVCSCGNRLGRSNC
jgi:hypothetical protein